MADDSERAFLRAVADEDCRTILQTIDEERKTVSEISEECDIPLSTVYRKVNDLQEVGLVEKQNRLCRDSKPENVYDLCFGGALITIGEDGEFEVAFVDEDDQSAADFGYPSRRPVESD